MTLITPCEPPQHSKWHLLSGSIVIALVYCITIGVVMWLMGR